MYPTFVRPPIGSLVQSGVHTPNNDHWDYTGIVTKHHPDNDQAFYVEWHKWGGSAGAEADNRTLWGYEWSMTFCRVIDKPQPGQWWPQ